MDIYPRQNRIRRMAAIRVIYDGKAFIPIEPVSLPDRSEALVIVEQTDPTGMAKLDAAVRSYYQGTLDADDDAWGKAVASDSSRAWDED